MTGLQSAVWRILSSAGPGGASVADIVEGVYPRRRPETAGPTIRKMIQRMRMSRRGADIVTVRRAGRPTVYRIEREARP